MVKKDIDEDARFRASQSRKFERGSRSSLSGIFYSRRTQVLHSRGTQLVHSCIFSYFLLGHFSRVSDIRRSSRSTVQGALTYLRDLVVFPPSQSGLMVNFLHERHAPSALWHFSHETYTRIALETYAPIALWHFSLETYTTMQLWHFSHVLKVGF